MDRLDSYIGIGNWQDSYLTTDKGVVCTLSLKVDGEWISKTDGGDYTQIEAFKGGMSDAFKRAGVKWGVARYLYELPVTFVDTNASKDKNSGFVNTGKTKENKYFYWKKPDIDFIMSKM